MCAGIEPPGYGVCGQRLQNGAASAGGVEHNLCSLRGCGLDGLRLNSHTLDDLLNWFFNNLNPHRDRSVSRGSTLLVGRSPALLGAPD